MRFFHKTVSQNNSVKNLISVWFVKKDCEKNFNPEAHGIKNKIIAKTMISIKPIKNPEEFKKGMKGFYFSMPAVKLLTFQNKLVLHTSMQIDILKEEPTAEVYFYDDFVKEFKMIINKKGELEHEKNNKNNKQ